MNGLVDEFSKSPDKKFEKYKQKYCLQFKKYLSQFESKFDSSTLSVHYDQLMELPNKEKLDDTAEHIFELNFYPHKNLFHEFKKTINIVNGGKKNDIGFILDEADIPQQLDHAVGSLEIDGEMLRYYGVRLREKITKKRYNKIEKKYYEVIVQEYVPALLLENGRLISQYSKPDELKFEFKTIMTLSHNRISLNTIKNFNFGRINTDDYTFFKCYKLIKTQFDNSMVYEQPEWYSLDAGKIIATYFQV